MVLLYGSTKNSLRTGNHGLFCQIISLVLNMVICHSNMLDYERIYGTNLLSLVVWFISILTICFRCALHIWHGTDKRALFNSNHVPEPAQAIPKVLSAAFFHAILGFDLKVVKGNIYLRAIH